MEETYHKGLETKCTVGFLENSPIFISPLLGRGYCYMLFESEKSVKALLNNCNHEFSTGGDWYFKISSRRMRCKEVQASDGWLTYFLDVKLYGILMKDVGNLL